MKRNDFGIIIATILFLLFIAVALGLLMWLIYIIGVRYVGIALVVFVCMAFVYAVIETLYNYYKLNKK